MARHKAPPRAFSLVELLVCLGIVGVLIGLILPALASVRNSARDTRQLSDLRQLGVSLAMYSSLSGDSFPFREQGTWLVWPEGSNAVTVSGANMSRFWAVPMHAVAPWAEHFDTWLAPRALARQDRWDRGADEPGLPLTSYQMSDALFVSPRAFVLGGVPPRPLYRGVRASEVQFPSNKVALWDIEKPLYAAPTDDVDERLMVFCDGHASQHRLSDAEPGAYFDNPLASAPASTKGGAYGIDYR